MASNTPPSPRHGFPFAGGEDYLKVVLGVTLPRPVLDGLQAAQAAAFSRDDGHRRGLFPFRFGPTAALMAPRGVSLGKKGKGPRMGYRIEHAGMTFLIADWRSSDEDHPNVYLAIPGTACLEHGGQGSLELARRVILQAGGTIDSEKLSRVDMALDAPLSIDTLYDAARERRYVARIRCLREIEHHTRTLIFGSAPLTLTIYDKLGEVRQRQDDAKLALMLARRWGNARPHHAIRIEYRILREKLREFGIDSPADYFRLRGALAAHLTREWLRFTAGPVDRRNRNTARAATLPAWQEIADGFAAWAGQPNGEVLAPLPPRPPDISRLLCQQYGLLKAIARAKAMDPIPASEFEEWVLRRALRSDRKETNAPKAHIGT